MSGPVPELPARPQSAHKGDFGTVLVVGGAVEPRTMLGGPALAANAALRAGCGLCELAMPEPLLVAGLGLAPSATGVTLPIDAEGSIDADAALAALAAPLARATVVAMGPGLGSGEGVDRLVAGVIELCRKRQLPLVLDADALNALARLAPSEPFAAPVIVTPHPGEFARLAQRLGLASCDPIDPDRRPASAAALSQRLAAVVVLKGPRSVIAAGRETSINSTGGPTLATGGSGDVLTGVIAGLWSQWREAGEDPDGGRSARAGVWLHGHAADRWAARQGSAGMLAGDLVEELPAAMRAMRNGDRSPE